MALKEISNIDKEVEKLKQAVDNYEKSNEETGRGHLLTLLDKKCKDLRSFVHDNPEKSEGRNATDSLEVSEMDRDNGYYFHKFSPLKEDVNLVIKCKICDKLLQSTRGFAAHLRKFHGEEDTRELMKEVQSTYEYNERGTCRLPSKDASGSECGLKVRLDLFRKHFKVRKMLY